VGVPLRRIQAPRGSRRWSPLAQLAPGSTLLMLVTLSKIIVANQNMSLNFHSRTLYFPDVIVRDTYVEFLCN
jgi:hypothetical protein